MEAQLQIAPNESVFSMQAFEHAQRIAKMLSASSLIPKEYQGRVDNVMIAMEMANRMNTSPLMVMQNLYIVYGKPGWSGSFVIAVINNSKRFKTDLQFEASGTKGADDYGYVAFAFNKDGERIESAKVDWKMVKAEGWLDKPGSKWKTMDEQMFRYRSATFFGRAYAPDLLMGMQTADEIIDISSETVSQETFTLEDLIALFEQRQHLLTDVDREGIHRILNNQESTSYKKVYNALIKLK